MIIDCHMHYTTAPRALTKWRDRQIEAFENNARPPGSSDLHVSDDEIRESIVNNQLRLMDERGIDLAIFSPRASFMAHHVGDFDVSAAWAGICNEMCFRVCEIFPERFVGAAMLPQSPGVAPETCLPELRRCIEDYGFVAININPDPSGGYWTGPPLTDRCWYPLYEKMIEYDIPAMVHVSTSCNACFHTTGAHYLNADTTAFMQLMTSDLFHDFPDLRLVIPHGGGAVPFHWGRYQGIAIRQGLPRPESYPLSNLFFDTCVYHQPGIDLLSRVIPVDHILFASEMLGAVRGVNPDTGVYFDDTKSYMTSTGLSAGDLHKVFEGNARKVYPRLNEILEKRGREAAAPGG